jgi:hypothetical protein
VCVSVCVCARTCVCVCGGGRVEDVECMERGEELADLGGWVEGTGWYELVKMRATNINDMLGGGWRKGGERSL